MGSVKDGKTQMPVDKAGYISNTPQCVFKASSVEPVSELGVKTRAANRNAD